VSPRALGWPPGRVAGRYLAAYLATARGARRGAAPAPPRARGSTRPTTGSVSGLRGERRGQPAALAGPRHFDERLARALVTAYREAGGDPGDDALLGFFAAQRALIRAKVALA